MDCLCESVGVIGHGGSCLETQHSGKARLSRVQGQPGVLGQARLQSETLSQKNHLQVHTHGSGESQKNHLHTRAHTRGSGASMGDIRVKDSKVERCWDTWSVEGQTNLVDRLSEVMVLQREDQLASMQGWDEGQ